MEKIFETIKEYHMIKEGDAVIAGVSGGADSVCLLYVLHKYQKQVPFFLKAVHIEHGIRGEESLEDARFVKELCEHLQVPFEMHSVKVQQIAKEQGLTIEEAGRRERYRIFNEVCKEPLCKVNGQVHIAVAHNQNDQAETVLWNLVRGSGLKGLGGIRPVRDNIIRPLLYTTREEIEDILNSAGIGWRMDRTNLETDYTRNRIRLKIIPEMQEYLNEQASWHISQAAEKLQEVYSYIEEMTQNAVQECLFIAENTDVLIHLDSFDVYPELIRKEILRKALEMKSNNLKDIGSIHISDLMELSHKSCGKELSLPYSLRAVREKGIVRITKQKHPKKEMDALPVKLEAVLPSREELECQPCVLVVGKWKITVKLSENTSGNLHENATKNVLTNRISYDIIKSASVFRYRKSGDYITITNDGKKKKLKDYMINEKIPRNQRNDMLLLADGSHILCFFGYRVSEVAKVTPQTDKILEITMEQMD